LTFAPFSFIFMPSRLSFRAEGALSLASSPRSPDPTSHQPFSRQLVVFTGKLSSLGRKEAQTLVAELGGAAADEVSAKTTMLVIGSEGFASGERASEAPEAPRLKSNKLRRAEELNARGQEQIEIVSEEQFCRLAGVPSPDTLKRQYYAQRDILARYRLLREDHLRYLTKCGLVTPVRRTNADTFYAFPDLAVVKQVSDDLERGVAFKAAAQSLLASRHGQLALDFRLEAAPAKIITLPRRPPPGPSVQAARAPAGRYAALAEEYFRAGSALDDGSADRRDEAAAAYRKALELDPYLVAALINLANIHYSRDELVEAQALYDRAIGLEPDYFEAHFNLGNIHHDVGRFAEAEACYLEALRLNAFYADAHFYLAVTLEKVGRSEEARAHWRSYQQLAPQGEWVELAREFSE
jgi:tetratricopeptide (TPR) repeat protein